MKKVICIKGPMDGIWWGPLGQHVHGPTMNEITTVLTENSIGYAFVEYPLLRA